MTARYDITNDKDILSLIRSHIRTHIKIKIYTP